MKTVNELLRQESATDAEIMECAYGVSNFSFDTMPTPEESQKLRVMRARLNEIEAMKRAALRARAAGRKAKVQLADCGHFTIEMMSTSRGTACPNCYDRMSD